MAEIQSTDILAEKAFEIILNFKPSDKYDKAVINDILKLQSEIKKVISILPRSEQEILELRYSQNLSEEKIAERLGKSREEAAKLISGGVKSLKEKLGKENLSFENVQKVIDISKIKYPSQNTQSTVQKPVAQPKIVTIKKPSFFRAIYSLIFYIVLFAGSYFVLQKFFFHDWLPLGQIISVGDLADQEIAIKRNKPLSIANSNSIRISGSSSLSVLARRWENSFNVDYPKYHISLVSSDSDKGVHGLLEGKIDIANSSRPVTFSDRKKASTLGLELAENRVALDALLIIVNSKNPINEISLDDLEKMFSKDTGRLYWKEIYSNQSFDKPVFPVVREKGSGTNNFVINRVLEGNDFPESFNRQTSNSDLIRFISTNEGAIGFINSTSYSWGNKNIKYLKVKNYDNSIAVSPFEGKNLNENAIRYGDYPLAHYLYLITLSDAPKRVQEFVSWVLSEDGQKIVSYSGLIPVMRNEN